VALRTSLPKGKTDKEHGLDYIPFMLDSLRDKRRRFDRRANIFFWVTIAVGLTFAGVITFFGYTLVAEHAVGLPRDVLDLRQEVSGIRKSLDQIDTSIVNTVALREVVDGLRGELKRLRLGEKNKPILERAISTLDNLKDIRQIDEVRAALDLLRSEVDTLEQRGVTLVKLLEAVDQRLEKFRDVVTSLWRDLGQQSHRTEEAIKKVIEFNDKGENRIVELLKRFSIGIIVATFFFGILRYVATQFRANWQQAVRAEDEDLWLRRFYVGMKSAGSNQSDRSSVISSLLTGMPDSAAGQNKAEDETSKINIDLLKELLSAISKKI
jgi:hypothetical protein